MNPLTVWHIYPYPGSIGQVHTAVLYEPHQPHLKDNDIQKEVWEMPDGFTVGEDNLGQPVVFDKNGHDCALCYEHGRMLCLASASGIFYLARYKGNGPPSTAIRDARTAAGLSLQSLANAVGITKGAMATIDLGKSVPRADTLRRIADVLGKTMDELWPD